MRGVGLVFWVSVSSLAIPDGRRAGRNLMQSPVTQIAGRELLGPRRCSFAIVLSPLMQDRNGRFGLVLTRGHCIENVIGCGFRRGLRPKITDARHEAAFRLAGWQLVHPFARCGQIRIRPLLREIFEDSVAVEAQGARAGDGTEGIVLGPVKAHARERLFPRRRIGKGCGCLELIVQFGEPSRHLRLAGTVVLRGRIGRQFQNDRTPRRAVRGHRGSRSSNDPAFRQITSVRNGLGIRNCQPHSGSDQRQADCRNCGKNGGSRALHRGVPGPAHHAGPGIACSQGPRTPPPQKLHLPRCRLRSPARRARNRSDEGNVWRPSTSGTTTSRHPPGRWCGGRLRCH